jgi:2-octaprenyl-6-methoxyphenol hydroxylase
MAELIADVDVAIVGAGPVGATLALALAHAGLSAALLDAQPVEARLDQGYDGRAWAIARGPMLQYHALGVGPAIEAAGEPSTSILVTEGEAPSAAARPPRPGHLGFGAAMIGAETGGAPLAILIENQPLRAILNGAVLAAGVRVIAPAEVAEARPDGAGVTLKLADGRRVRAAVAVAADGRGSRLRTAAGIGVTGWQYGQMGVVGTVQLSAPHGGVAHEFFMPSSALAVLPLTGGRASLVWVEPTARGQALLACDERAFEAHLNRRLGDTLGPARLASPRFGYPLGLQFAERMTGERLALVGDAGHAIHPIAGQGLNLGLKDVAALAEVLSEAHRRGEDIGGAAVLDRYARWRRVDRAAFMAATDFFVRAYGWSNPLFGVVRRTVTGAMERLPPVKRAMMMEAAGLAGEPPRLLRGEAL